MKEVRFYSNYYCYLFFLGEEKTNDSFTEIKLYTKNADKN